MLDTYLKWFHSHERLIVIVLVLVALTYGLNRWLDKSATDADAKAAVAAQVAADAKTSQKQADANAAQLIAQVQQQTTLLQAQVTADKQTIASLVAAVASRDAASSNRVTQVSGTKTPPQAVADLSSVYTLVAPIVPTDTGAVVPTADLQQFTVAKIEGDTAKADLQDTKSQLSAAQHEASDLETIVVAKDKVITQDSATLAAHDAAAAADAKKSQADIDQLKKDARRSKWHTFWVGFAAGFIGRQAVSSYTGH
jgi:hypothetical protein